MARDYLLDLVRPRVAPADKRWVDGIETRDGIALPFLVERAWAGPAGNYIEQWSLRRDVNDVLYRSDERYVSVRGMQSVTEYIDRVDEAIRLETGSYLLVFVVEGLFMGSTEIEVKAAGHAAA